MNEDDRNIRQKLQKQDIGFSQQLKKQMENQEKLLKGYFKQFKKPIAQDPSIIKKQIDKDKMGVYREITKPFKLFYIFYQFWKMNPRTPQERQCHRISKEYIRTQIITGVAFSLLVTTLTSIKFRMYLDWKMHIFGLSTGILSGCLYGLLSSTKNTLQTFEKLGQNYHLGRVALTDVERFRMDKKPN